MKDGTYLFKNCVFCDGMGVKADSELCKFWRRYYRGALVRASAEGRKDEEYFETAHRRVSVVLSKYPPCSVCKGKGKYKKFIPDLSGPEDPFKKFFEDGDGWLT